MRTGRLLALSAATLLCSPVVSLVVLRYVFLKGGTLNTALAKYPSLIAGLIATLGLLSGLAWLLFSTYRQRSRWPRTCGLASQSGVPQYLHGGDLFLLQLPFCAAQLATVMAVAQLEMTAPRAVVASYGAGVACVALCAIYPAPRCCRAGGGSWAKEAARHGRLGVLVSLVLCLGAVFGFLFTSYSTASSFGVSFSSQSYYGFALLGGAQACIVGRNAMARCLIRRNARRLHGAASPALIAAIEKKERDREAAIQRTAVTAAAAAPGPAPDVTAAGSANTKASDKVAQAPKDESRDPEPDWLTGQELAGHGGEYQEQDQEQEDEDAHLFRGLDEDELTKLDAVFTTPLYLHHPIAVGTVGTFEMGQLGGHLALAPVALLVFYGTNTSAAMFTWLQNDLGLVPMLCIGWLALASVMQAPLYSALALAGPPAAIAYVDVLATATAALLGAFVLSDSSAPSPELGPPQLAGLCVFAAAAAIGLMSRSNAAEAAASQQQLLYLADALPNLSAVQMEDLMRVDVSAGHEVFQRLVAEAGYGGTVPPTVPPRWTADAVSINPTLSRARELEAERELLRFQFPGLESPPPTPPSGASPPRPSSESRQQDEEEAVAAAAAAAAAAAGEEADVLVPTPPSGTPRRSPEQRSGSSRGGGGGSDGDGDGSRAAEPEITVESLDGEPELLP
jgi:hypothetical protein